MTKALAICVIAVTVAMMIAISVPFASSARQSLGGCPAGGVAPPADFFLPNLTHGFIVVSDERRDADQLAETFADPADALSRLHAYCWTGQAERTYVRDQLVVDVSVHTFVLPEGATLAQYWFSYQRVERLGLRYDTGTRLQLQTDIPQMDIEVLDNLFIFSLYNEGEYTLYARRGEIVTRVSVSGESSVPGRSRKFVAYQVLGVVFGLDLFNYPHSLP